MWTRPVLGAGTGTAGLGDGTSTERGPADSPVSTATEQATPRLSGLETRHGPVATWAGRPGWHITQQAGWLTGDRGCLLWPLLVAYSSLARRLGCRKGVPRGLPLGPQDPRCSSRPSGHSEQLQSGGAPATIPKSSTKFWYLTVLRSRVPAKHCAGAPPASRGSWSPRHPPRCTVSSNRAKG